MEARCDLYKEYKRQMNSLSSFGAKFVNWMSYPTDKNPLECDMFGNKKNLCEIEELSEYVREFIIDNINDCHKKFGQNGLDDWLYNYKLYDSYLEKLIAGEFSKSEYCVKASELVRQYNTYPSVYEVVSEFEKQHGTLDSPEKRAAFILMCENSTKFEYMKVAVNDEVKKIEEYNDTHGILTLARGKVIDNIDVLIKKTMSLYYYPKFKKDFYEDSNVPRAIATKLLLEDRCGMNIREIERDIINGHDPFRNIDITENEDKLDQYAEAIKDGSKAVRQRLLEEERETKRRREPVIK